MKNKLLDLINKTNPKKLSQAVKQDQILFEWVQTSSGDTISEKIYNLTSKESTLCQYGNNRKFKSIVQGYGFCGKAAACRCAKESISSSVSAAKSQYSCDKRKEIQQKRKETTVLKYGIENVGQLSTAIAHHQRLYNSLELVTTINAQIKETKQKRYENANYNNADKIKQTFKEKRNAGFWIDKFPEKNITTLENKDMLLSLYNRYTPIEIADQLNVHVQTVYKYLNSHKLRDPFKSTDEQELVRYIESLGIINVVRNTRKLLPSGKEIDIYLPDLKIAIEYNGVYWHHEDIDHITRDYHYNKFIECEKLGIQLITIFSNFWHTKKDIVKRVLKIKLNCFKDPPVYARKCKSKIIDNKTAKDFLNAYHIQGYTPSSFCVGLFADTALVSVMTFSKNRTGIGKSNSDTELVRFASSGLIVGAASKLLAAYRTQFPSETIVSYSDNEWSTGKLYNTLGFKLDSEIKYSYWYLKPREHRLYHRFTFSKQKLIKMGHNPEKTETQITKDMGLLKVWDCGKRKWILE